jgi:prophage regulatory protein
MRLLDHNGLRELGITYSKTQLWRLQKAGKFPVPVKLSSQRNAYVESEVIEWMEAQVAARDIAASDNNVPPKKKARTVREHHPG